MLPDLPFSNALAVGNEDAGMILLRMEACTSPIPSRDVGIHSKSTLSSNASGEGSAFSFMVLLLFRKKQPLHGFREDVSPILFLVLSVGIYDDVKCSEFTRKKAIRYGLLELVDVLA